MGDTYNVRAGQSFTAVLGGMPSETGQLPPSYPPADLKPAIGPPALAPALALIASAGNVNVGLHRYQVTFQTAYGESNGGPEAAITTDLAHGQVTVPLPIGPAGTTGRRIYRTAAGGAAGSEQLLATVANNTTASYTDNLPDSGLTVPTPLYDNTGQLGVQIVPLAGGTPVLPRTTAGVQQQLPHSAIYAVQLTAPPYPPTGNPPPSGDYTVLWDYNGGQPPFFSQTLQIDTTIPVLGGVNQTGGSLSPVYVQVGASTDAANNIVSLNSYLDPTMLAQALALSTPELNHIIIEAELEIDSILGFWIRDPTTGRKINLTNIVPVAPISPFPGELFAPYQRGVTIYQKFALQSAVCAQVEYHLEMGEEFFRKTDFDRVSGPQFSREGQRPRIAPKARQHLAQMGLIRRVARMVI